MLKVLNVATSTGSSAYSCADSLEKLRSMSIKPIGYDLG